MALSKAVVVEKYGTNITANYHRINNINVFDGNMTVDVSGYADETARRAGAEPIYQQNWAMDADAATASGETLIINTVKKSGYEFLKTLPDFDGATDC